MIRTAWFNNSPINFGKASIKITQRPQVGQSARPLSWIEFRKERAGLAFIEAFQVLGTARFYRRLAPDAQKLRIVLAGMTAVRLNSIRGFFASFFAPQKMKNNIRAFD